MEMKIRQLRLGDTVEKLFPGKPFTGPLVQAALKLKLEVSVNADAACAESSYPPGASAARSKYWKICPVSTLPDYRLALRCKLMVQRVVLLPLWWEWMVTTLPAINNLRFPPLDLARTLTNHCFEDIMPLLPQLHRPTFERQYAEGPHRHDLDFARLLLMLYAIGSRYCDYERLYVKSSEGVIEWSSAGCMYFAQAYQMTKPVFPSEKLVDLQIMSLSAAYLEGTGAWLSVWLINGIGFRYSVDAGNHRESLYASGHAFANQMWKRASWCLVKDQEMRACAFRIHASETLHSSSIYIR